MLNNYEVLNEYSILGSINYPPYTHLQPTQAAIVTVKTYPRDRIFLGCASGMEKEDIFQGVAAIGNELSFEFIEKLYLKMKAER